jgi:hypothetical protein
VILSQGGDGFRADNIGTAERCFEVQGYTPTGTIPRIVCWNFDSGRTLQVNGQSIDCLNFAGYLLSVRRAGGYCVQVSAGGGQDAGFVFPLI